MSEFMMSDFVPIHHLMTNRHFQIEQLSHFQIVYSVLKLFTGFISAALIL
jgi:hypothetical protein